MWALFGGLDLYYLLIEIYTQYNGIYIYSHYIYVYIIALILSLEIP